MDSRDGQGPGPQRGRALAHKLPIVLLAMAGACGLSALIGIVAAVLGRPEPPLIAMLVPPVLVVFGTPWYLLRTRGAGR